MLTNSIKITTFILGIILALISMVCSILMWISFANSTLDILMAAITSASLVGASYIFIPMIVRLYEFKRWALLTATLILEVILVLSSLAATISWLESRYQTTFHLELSGSTSYQHQQTQINDLTNRINELSALAKLDRENGFRTRAGSLLNKAERLSQERQFLISQKTTRQSDNSGTTLANDLGDQRYVLWTVLAVLVDGCPMVCFAVLSAGQRNKAIQPISKNLPTPIRRDAPTDDNETLYAEIATELKAGRWGNKPAMRNVITDKKIRHALAREFFDRYVVDGTLTLNGARFELAA